MDGEVTKEYGSSWIFEPSLTCSNALRRVQHPGFSLVIRSVEGRSESFRFALAKAESDKLLLGFAGPVDESD